MNNHPAKFLHIFVERLLPDYVREDHPMFVEFMQEFFKYLERETPEGVGEYKNIAELVQNVDIDAKIEMFLPEFEKQYLNSFPKKAIDVNVQTTDKAFLAKNIRKVYKKKGTIASYEFLFRSQFDKDVEIFLPKKDILRASGGTWYQPKWIHLDSDEETSYTIYNKRIVGGTSGAKAFVDVEEWQRAVDYAKMPLVEIEGEFLLGEPVFIEGDETPIANCLSDGVQYTGKCYLYGVIDETLSASGQASCTVRDGGTWLTDGYWTDTSGFLSSDKVMQDNSYYQDFSYVVKSEVPLNDYKEVLKKLVHPVGLKIFGEYLYTSIVPFGLALPEKHSRYLLSIFSYLDVGIDIWDPETKTSGTLGHAHTGFEYYLDEKFNALEIELVADIDLSSNDFVHPPEWTHPEDHLSINILKYGGVIGVKFKEKLYVISTMNDTVKNLISAYPEKIILEQLSSVNVLPDSTLDGTATILNIGGQPWKVVDGRMISCEVWELTVAQNEMVVQKWIESRVQKFEFAKELTYKYWEEHREDMYVANVYSKTCDIIDGIKIGMFEDDDGNTIHTEKGGFAPEVDLSLIKGLTAPQLDVGVASFHVHYFDDTNIPGGTLTSGDVQVLAETLSVTQARDLINNDAYQVPEFFFENLLCSGIMTPPLWGDWVDSHEARYNGVGECFSNMYQDEASCIAAFGDPMFWMGPSCTNQSSTSESACNTDGHSWGYFTLESLPADKGHVSYFEEGYVVVDKMYNRNSRTLQRDDARDILDGNLPYVTLYDNLADIQNIRGETTSTHYHEYQVSFNHNWEDNPDLEHGWVMTPITTWLCFNYVPNADVDPTIMGGMDFLGNLWPQNVYYPISDNFVQDAIKNPGATLFHEMTINEDHLPQIDWVEIASSIDITTEASAGSIGDLLETTTFTDTGLDASGDYRDAVVITHDGVNADIVYVVEQQGLIQKMTPDGVYIGQVMDITDRSVPLSWYDERGLLGMAFHPDFATNGKFYLHYEAIHPDNDFDIWGYTHVETVISEWTMDTTTLTCDTSTEVILFKQNQPEMNHNGGWIGFSPTDGNNLYVALGDGGAWDDLHGTYGNGQNLTNVLGTICRINVAGDGTFTIPTDNPFLDPLSNGVQPDPRIFAYGFRNPYRCSFDSTGRFFVADVGQNKFEEVNIVESGGNYGWRVKEGFHDFEIDADVITEIWTALGYTNLVDYFNDLQYPIFEYSHSTGISICGGFLYEGTVIPDLQGKYVFGDWSTDWAGTSGKLHYLEETSQAGTLYNFRLEGGNHTHDFQISQTEFLAMIAGTPATATQTDTLHATSYTHTIEIGWDIVNEVFTLISQTSDFDNHDSVLDAGTEGATQWTHNELTGFDPALPDQVELTLGQSLLTIGMDMVGEIYYATRTGIATSTGTAPGGAVIGLGGEGWAGTGFNTTIHKFKALYDSNDYPVAAGYIPGQTVAHYHTYKTTWNSIISQFEIEEISDVWAEPYDPLDPIWVFKDPVTHIHPTTSTWTGAVDAIIPIGSSSGWDGYEAYDIGSDTPWRPPTEEGAGYISINVAPTINLGASHEYNTDDHNHYFTGEILDPIGPNGGRVSSLPNRLTAEQLANNIISEYIFFTTAEQSGDNNLHYHELRMIYNSVLMRFEVTEVAEWHDPQGDYTFQTTEEKTHSHSIYVDGQQTYLGFNGVPVYDAPLVTIAQAIDWDNLDGKPPAHVHIFDSLPLDLIGPYVGRTSAPLNDFQATDLKEGNVGEIRIYSGITVDQTVEHYHEYAVTYNANSQQYSTDEIEEWTDEDHDGQFAKVVPLAIHEHSVTTSGLVTNIRRDGLMAEDDLPFADLPPAPFPGGSHPHHFNGSPLDTSGVYAGRRADFLTVSQAMALINEDTNQVTVYDSIEGSHYHQYNIKWNDTLRQFYCDTSSTWLRNEDNPGVFEPAISEGPDHGTHWHNITIDWNPDDLLQQAGMSVYVTKVVTTETPVVEVATNAVITVIDENPVITTTNDEPEAGDTTTVIQYFQTTIDTTTTTTTTTTTVSEIIYYSDASAVQQPDVVTPVEVETVTQSSNTVELLNQRKTLVNDVLQARNYPIMIIAPSTLSGEGAHDHIQFLTCLLDTLGSFAGRVCEPMTIEQTNDLINLQDQYAYHITFDNPNGADDHYHSYKWQYNPFSEMFQCTSFEMYNLVSGTSDSIHFFTLSGGFHTHSYWITEAEWTDIVVNGNQVVTPQRDDTHATIYTHTLTIAYINATWTIIDQTSDFDQHTTLSYEGSQTSGGQWIYVIPDHHHDTVIDDTEVWPEPNAFGL